MANHYTAIVEIVEVNDTKPTGDRGIPKDKTELARFVVRYDTLEGLKEKLQKYIELV